MDDKWQPCKKDLKCNICINPTALRQAKIVYNFGLSKYNRVKMAENVDIHSCTSNRSKIILSKFSYSRLNLFVTDVDKQSSVTDIMTHTLTVMVDLH